MGSLILCHKKRAKQPYVITRVHIRIYTIEELCYYICNNLYLLDYTLMNQQLCEWIAEELQMKRLAEELLDEMGKNCTVEQFVLLILQGSHIYAHSEISKIEGLLRDCRARTVWKRRNTKQTACFRVKSMQRQFWSTSQ